MSWDAWYADDLPCVFTRKQTRDNAAFLQEILSASFIQSSKRIRSEHPLLGMWDSVGPTSLLYLNSLAEDLRILEQKPNLEVLVHDLRDIGACFPARHALRSAALLERARAGTIVEFVRAHNETAPDFVMSLDGAYISVEAKLLMTSQLEAAFQQKAEAIQQWVIEYAKGRSMLSELRL